MLFGRRLSRKGAQRTVVLDTGYGGVERKHTFHKRCARPVRRHVRRRPLGGETLSLSYGTVGVPQSDAVVSHNFVRMWHVTNETGGVDGAPGVK